MIALATSSVLAALHVWTGSGNGYWGVGDNFSSDGVITGGWGMYFRSGVNDNSGNEITVKSFDVNFRNSASYNGNFTVDRGTSPVKPVTFVADADSYGISLINNGALYVGTAGSDYGDGHLQIKNGTYSFYGVNLGQNAANPESSGYLTLGSSDRDTKLTLTGDFLIHSGEVRAPNTNAKITVGRYLKISDANGSTANFKYDGDLLVTSTMQTSVGSDSVSTIEKNAGDWILDQLSIGHGANATSTLVQRGGKINLSRANNWSLALGVGNNSIATVTNDGGDWDIKGYLALAWSSSSTATFYMNGGTMSIADYLAVTRDGSGEFYMNGGLVTVLNDVWFGSYALNKNNNEYGRMYLNGGVLEAKSFRYHQSDAPGEVIFNGGTFRANSSGKISTDNKNRDDSALRNLLLFKVGPNGGTIDTGRHDITNVVNITRTSGNGGLRFIGGGSVTLTGSIEYNGKTSVEAGTMLVVSNSDGVSKVLSQGLELIGVPTLGKPYTVFACNDTLTNDDLANVTCPIAESFTSAIGADGKSIVMTVTTLKSAYWTGAKDGNLSDPANWSDGVVPTSGSPVICCPSATRLTVGDTFCADTITIPDGSAVLTLVDSLTLATLTNANKLAIASTGSLTVTGDLVVCDGKGTFLHSNEGSVTVGRVVCAKVASVATSKQYDVVTESSKPIRTGGFLYDTSAYWRMESNTAGAGSWIVGENGFKFANLNSAGGNAYRFYAQHSPVVLYSSADWTLACTGLPKTDRGDMQVYDNSSLTIDTSDYDTPAIPRTVTLEGRIVAYGPVMIKGCGKVVVNTVDMSDAAGVADDLKHTCVTNATKLSVTDTATLQINAGKKITGNGKVALAAGTKLVLDSGALGAMGDEGFVPCIPGLVLPPAGTATIRIDGARLRSGDHAIAAVASGETGSVAPDLSGTALDGRRATLRVEGGNLILNIEPNGTRIIIR